MKNVCRIENKTFRYDREHCIVEHITKATEDMFTDNVEWKKKHGKDLWKIDEDGYYVENSIGFRPENWDDKAARAEYLSEWASEINDETDYLITEAIKEFC